MFYPIFLPLTSFIEFVYPVYEEDLSSLEKEMLEPLQATQFLPGKSMDKGA